MSLCRIGHTLPALKIFGLSWYLPMPLRALCVLVATFFLTACDGEPVNYSSTQYDISWLWVAGLDTANGAGSHGERGVPANTNRPGARSGSVSWTDANGNFWMFGGFGQAASGPAGHLNDLWKFDTSPTALGWVWMAGSDVTNVAGIYGVQGESAAENMPGGRQHAVGWADASGNLYLFGGEGYAAGTTVGGLNDLWKFTIDTGRWTWLGGADAGNATGVYGNQGESASTNIPGGRYGAVGWVQPLAAPATAPTFWLFGGAGIDGAAAPGLLNDLWKLEPDTGAWTWVSGSATADAAALYGSVGVPAAANVPGGRVGAAAWHDKDGQAWLFGGAGEVAGERVVLNELWKFVERADLDGDAVANDPDDGPGWSWIGGTQGAFAVGEYGGRGVPSPVNAPPGRSRPIVWLDANGTRLWMFGGTVESVAGTETHPNDLWRYDSAAPGFWTWVGGPRPDAADAPGDYKGLLQQGQPAGRGAGVGWVNARGLWLFGGGAGSERRNDFWVVAP